LAVARFIRLALATAPGRSGLTMPFALRIVVSGPLLESLIGLAIDLG
jgi:hypothetical protein